MTVDERERHDLYARLIEVLGEEAAMTLMNHLPPSGWADVATKHDLESLSREMRAEIAGIRGEVSSDIGALRAEMYAEFTRQTRIYIFATLTAVVTVGGVAFGAAGLM